MTSIYVVRHGETKENLLDLINGRNDGELTEVGKGQAQKAAEQLKNQNIDLIIASPLKRTKQTAKIINIKGIETIYDADKIKNLHQRNCEIVKYNLN